MPYIPAFRHLKALYEGYTLHVYSILLAAEMETPCTGEGKGYTLHVFTLRGGEGYTLHIHTACGGKGYTLTSTSLTVERDTISRPHCWWWKGIQPHVHTVD
jgi:hypothetical protein